MVPEEADQLDEKFDSGAATTKGGTGPYMRLKTIYSTTPETQHHNIDFVLIATTTTPAAATQGTKAGHSPASKAPGLTKSLATSAAKAAGGM